MERSEVDNIRLRTFTESRRGFDRREVQQFLGELADWLESGAQDEANSYAVQRKLERAGETTARVLATAEKEAEQLRKEAQSDFDRVTARASQVARETMEAAQAKARRTIEEGEQRRLAIEDVISTLIARRDAVLADLERLQASLGVAVAEHKPAPGQDAFARPAVLDPAERKGPSEETKTSPIPTGAAAANARRRPAKAVETAPTAQQTPA
jgi:cell division septum initiation protein DivIVA